MGLKNVLHRAAGYFVEIPDTPADFNPMMDPTLDPAPKSIPTPTAVPQTRTVEDVVKAAAGPNLDQIQAPPDTAKSPPIGPDGVPDYNTIFTRSGVPTVSFGAEEALQVIGSLPAELPMDVKRKTVGATLSAMGKAMGVTTDSVVSDASRKIAALASFTDQLTSQTHQYQVLVEQKVADLKAQITSCESDLARAQEKLGSVVKQCEAEGHRLDEVLEFFTLDVPPSKNA